MKENNLNRSLNGKEREQERIAIKRFEVQKQKLSLEKDLNKNEIFSLGVEMEDKELKIKELTERIEKGKRLVTGAKICDVFPPVNPLEIKPDKEKPIEIDEDAAKKHLKKVKKEQEKGSGGESSETKV